MKYYELDSKFRLSPNNPLKIGIIGGGQLGKMIALEAKRMSFNIIILDPAEDCPASSLADEQIVANFDDKNAIIELANKSDIVTYEIELANVEVLRMLEEQGHKVAPSSYSLEIIQDKLLQRKVLKDNNLPVPDFQEVYSKESLLKALDKLGYPAVLKARRGSYDGRGNFIIRNENDIEDALRFMHNKPSFLEEFVHFSKEVSTMIARNKYGIVSFPLAENIHLDNILYLTMVPARVDDDVKEEAIKVAQNTVKILKGSGIFGIEMFVADKVLINEIAPRVHNSGHYSIEACDISQFEMHIRAITDLPLPKPRLLSAAAMINILGDNSFDKYAFEGINDVLSLPGVKLHIYGKKASRRNRKLGHITSLAENLEEAIMKATKARDMLRIVSIE